MKNTRSRHRARSLRELTARELDKVEGGELDKPGSGIVATGNPPPTEPITPG